MSEVIRLYPRTTRIPWKMMGGRTPTTREAHQLDWLFDSGIIDRHQHLTEFGKAKLESVGALDRATVGEEFLAKVRVGA